MFAEGGPCVSGESWVNVIAAVGVVLNALLLTFLTKRRITADIKNDERWSKCPVLNGEDSPAHHQHRPTKGER